MGVSDAGARALQTEGGVKPPLQRRRGHDLSCPYRWRGMRRQTRVARTKSGPGEPGPYKGRAGEMTGPSESLRTSPLGES